MLLKMYFGGFIISSFAVVISVVSEHDFLAYAAGVSAIGLALVTVYKKFREVKTKADLDERESRRKDCEEMLKYQKSINSDSDHRISALEKQSDGWRHLYESHVNEKPTKSE